MPSLGPFEIAIILVMVLILFGPGKLPQVFGALGDGMRQFKKASQGITDDVNTAMVEPIAPPAAEKTSPSANVTPSDVPAPSPSSAS